MYECGAEFGPFFYGGCFQVSVMCSTMLNFTLRSSDQQSAW